MISASQKETNTFEECAECTCHNRKDLRTQYDLLKSNNVNRWYLEYVNNARDIFQRKAYAEK